ncbi:hypothetical protein GH733_014020 [Mirounga leonina]|nr:hypothetical protein GH733_014020 [Mirounga leonina]
MVPSASWSKQQTCLDCKKNFCMTCSSQVGNGPHLCLLCQRVRATAFRREELMKMKVKDLRDYLSLHDISTEVCREKEELVLLVLDQQEGRTRAPPLVPGLPRAAGLPGPASCRHSTSYLGEPPLFAHTSHANGHVSQDQEEPVYLESTARAPAEDETQVGPLLRSVPLRLLFSLVVVGGD